MRIALCSAVWGRLPLTKVWWSAVDRIQAQFDDAEHAAEVFVGGSEWSHRDLCRLWEGNWIQTPNNPLGAKWNAVVTRALDFRPDYIFILGSDDFFSPALIDQYIEVINRRVRFAGLSSIYFHEPKSARTLYYHMDRATSVPVIQSTSTWEAGQIPRSRGMCDIRSPRRKVDIRTIRSKVGRSAFGAGRLIHRSYFLGHTEFWDLNIDKALDASMDRCLNLGRVHQIHLGGQSVALDVKTPENIWTFDSLIEKSPLCVESSSEMLAAIPEWPDIQSLANQAEGRG